MQCFEPTFPSYWIDFMLSKKTFEKSQRNIVQPRTIFDCSFGSTFLAVFRKLVKTFSVSINLWKVSCAFYFFCFYGFIFLCLFLLFYIFRPLQKKKNVSQLMTLNRKSRNHFSFLKLFCVKFVESHVSTLSCLKNNNLRSFPFPWPTPRPLPVDHIKIKLNDFLFCNGKAQNSRNK